MNMPKSLVAPLLLAIAAHAAEPPHAVDPAFDRYATPADRVTLPGGRTLNLDCRGAGAPTVLLFPGLNAWSEVWVKVHDPIARHRRVCAFDPAGFGFSGPSAEPQDATHIVGDLEAALTAAKVTHPYVVVGHSAGGLQALTFADRHKRETVGIVLVDPSYPGIYDDFERVAPNLSRAFADKASSQMAAYGRCAESLEAGRIAANDPAARGCFLYRSQYPDTLRAALAAVETPARMRTKIAHVNDFAASSHQAVNPRRDYGAMPLIVLTRGNMGPPPGSPPPPKEEAAEGGAIDRAWIAGHEALARLSAHGERRTVPGTGHMVQFENADAVTTAIEDVVNAGLR